MSNLLKKVIILITQIPLWILEVLGFRSEMKEVTNNVKRKKLPKPKAKSRPKSGPKAAPLLVQEVGKLCLCPYVGCSFCFERKRVRR